MGVGRQVQAAGNVLMEAFFIKTTSSSLVPATDHDRELLKHIKISQATKLSFKRVRNYEFHKKYFALLNIAFESWEPPEHGEGSAWAEKMPVTRDFDRFRKDVIILAGHYEATYPLPFTICQRMSLRSCTRLQSPRS